MGIFKVNRKEKVEVNNKECYTGPANEIVFIPEEKDIHFMCGLTVDLIICNFARTPETEKQLRPYITDGHYTTGVIKYLK